MSPGTWVKIISHSFIPSKYVGLRGQIFSRLTSGLLCVSVYKDGVIIGVINAPPSAFSSIPQFYK